MNKSEYIALKARIEYELLNIDLIENTLEKEGLFPEPVSNSISGLDIASDLARRAIGSYLHDYYSAVEKIASHVCRATGEGMPKGDDWHYQLIFNMSLELNGLRPRLFSVELLNLLNEFKGFRQVFRNVYGINIDSKKEIVLLKKLSKTSKLLRKDIAAFLSIMDEALL
ncbi:MAG: hypothetical protein GX301_03625 [Gracilibacteraceae bacterium]|nr:hypothetical protein [Gracilibacteraceae bacterium]